MTKEIMTLKPSNEWENDSIVTHTPNMQYPCNSLWNQINVTCEGFLTLCCSEAFNYNVICDINKTNIVDAFNSPQMREMRRKHIQGDLSGTQCGKCIGLFCGEVRPLNQSLVQEEK